MASSRDFLMYAFRRVLRPLVRILIRSGVQFDSFVELAKGVFVETALRDGLNDVQHPSRSRISITTGIPRREVDRFIDDPDALPKANATLAQVIVEVLHRWHTEPNYGGPYNLPRELELESDTGPSFFSLVAETQAGVDSMAVLTELLESGAVQRSGDSHYRAASRYFMPETMSAAQIENFGNAMARLANTLQHNMDTTVLAKRVERFVVADRGLPLDLVPDFEAFVRERLTGTLVEIDNWLAANSVIDTAQSNQERVAAGINVFTYVEELTAEAALHALAPPVQDP